MSKGHRQEFSIYFIESNGSYNHCLLEADKMSDAVRYVEECRKGIVYKAVVRTADGKE